MGKCMSSTPLWETHEAYTHVCGLSNLRILWCSVFHGDIEKMIDQSFSLYQKKQNQKRKLNKNGFQTLRGEKGREMRSSSPTHISTNERWLLFCVQSEKGEQFFYIQSLHTIGMQSLPPRLIIKKKIYRQKNKRRSLETEKKEKNKQSSACLYLHLK